MNISKLTLTPVTLRQAQAFVNEHHRHNIAPRGHKFSIGLEKDGILIGVCIVGRPIARCSDDGKTAEVLRVCVLEGNPNANSKLYGAAVRAWYSKGGKDRQKNRSKTFQGVAKAMAEQWAGKSDHKEISL